MKTHSLTVVFTALLSAIILIASNAVFADGAEKFRCSANSTGAIDASMDARLEIDTGDGRMKFDVSYEEAVTDENHEEGDVLDVFLNDVKVGEITLALENQDKDLAGDLDTDTEEGDTVTAMPGDKVAVGGLNCDLPSS